MTKLITILIMSSLLFFNCSKDEGNEDSTYECNSLPWFKDTTTRLAESTLKGQILFSWKNNENTWNYAIAPNLNIKPAYEMVSTGNCMTGEDCLKNNLQYFAVGEDIYWNATGDLQIQDGNKVELSYPPAEIILDLKTFCDSINIDLIIN